MGLITNQLKRLYNDKWNTIYSALKIALWVAVPVAIVSITLSFAGNSFVELVNISTFLKFYAQDTTNSVYKLCSAISVVSVILGAGAVGLFFLKKALSQKKQYKNYLIMGASFGQLSLMTVVESFALLFMGLIVGAIISYVIGLIVGSVFAIKVFFNMDMFLITGLVYLALTTIISVVVPLWTATSER